ncbi:tandem-95 repeat protein [Rhizobium sp. CG5]|uniref:putative Ig domain-containing protein n=1 Tax=Rhizobium sp. CG5 TaxID=2726076 RepID=UPI002033FA22|nr:putative Ig domain-containing protein [Rhizobium sp. CG5]MCM2474840.1 tandem-95 repeat protein [Rhizobium sp. CG5]
MLALWTIAYVSSSPAAAADLYYTIYYGDTVRIPVNSYGQNAVGYDHTSTVGLIEPVYDLTFDVTYTPRNGFVGTDVFTYTAYSDAWVAVGTDTIHITVKPKITFSSSTLPNAKQGEAYSQSVTASFNAGSQSVTYWVSAGTLPAGLSLDTQSGTISGIPSASGTSYFQFHAANGDGYSALQSMTIAVGPHIDDVTATVAANSSSNAIGVTVSGTESLTAVSTPSHGSASISGATLSYTPTSGYSGTDSFTYTVTDSASGLSDSATVSLTVTAPTLSIAPSSLPDGTAGTTYSQTLSATSGTSPYSYAVTSGALPDGLSLSSSGAISGTPTSAGSESLTVTATDAYGATGSQAYTLAIAIAAPVASNSNATVAANSSSNTIALSLSGGTTASVTVASAPSHGTATASGTSITYTPTSGYSGTDSFTYTASNATGDSTATVSLTVTAPVVTVTPTTLSDGTVGVAYSQTLSASNGTAPYSYSLYSGTLPPGLTLSSAGILSGTPTTQGTYSFVLGVTDQYGAWGAPAYTAAIAIAAPVADDVSATVDANSGDNSITLDLSGGTASSVAVASAPSHGTATASGTAITYTPTSGYSGTDSFTYTASNASGDSTATVSITVTAPPLSVAPSSLPDGTAGVGYSQTLSASNGTAPYSYSLSSGTLPPGLILSSAGVLSGSPTTQGTYSFVLGVTDRYGAQGAPAYSVAIAVAAPVASDVSATVAANSSDNTITLDLSGGTASSVTIASAPSHGTATASGTAITYTPTSGYSGTDSFTYTATNATDTSSAATVSITVSEPTLTLSPTTLADGTVGTAYSSSLSSANGTAPYRYAVTSGALPDGLTLTSAGLLSGTPTEDGTFSFTLTSTDAYGAIGSQAYSVAMAVQAPAAAAVSATVAANSTDNAITLSLGGGTASSVTIASAPSHGTATASGTAITYTPTPGYSGTDSFTYSATNATGTSSAATVSITVSEPTLTIRPTTLSGGTVGTAYSVSLSSANGTAPYRYSVTSGALPDGLTLSSAGLLSGTPTEDGSFSFTLTTTDTYGAIGSRAYSVAVAVQAPTPAAVSATVAANSSDNAITLSLGGGTAASVAIASAPSHGLATASGTAITYTPTSGYSGTDSFTYTATNATGTSSAATVSITVTAPTLTISPAGPFSLKTGQTFSQAFSASGGTAPYSFSVSGTLPSGLTFKASSAELSGTPLAVGSSEFNLTATDTFGATTTISVSLDIETGVSTPSPKTVTVSTGGATTVSLTDGASGGPFTGANLVALSPASAGTAIITLGDTAASTSDGAFGAAYAAGNYTLKFTPKPGYTGTAVATYTLSSALGTSDPGTITFAVAARDDLTTDADVVGLVTAQASAARRLAEGQIDTVTDHLRALRGKSCLENSLGLSLSDGHDGDAPVSASTSCSPFAGGNLAFWIAGSASFGDESGQYSIEQAMGSFSAGLDYRVTDKIVAGLSLGFGRDYSDIGTNGTESRNDALSATAYALYQPGNGFYIDALAGAGLLDFSSLRVTSGGAQAEADREGHQVYLSLGLGYDWKADGWLISPHGRISASRSILDAVSETGADWENIAYGEQQIDSLKATLGLTVSHDIRLEDMVLTPELTLDFSHALQEDDDIAVSYADGGGAYVIDGTSGRTNSMSTVFALKLATVKGAALTGRYGATFDGDGLRSQRFGLDLGGRF